MRTHHFHKKNINFTPLSTPNNINTSKTELQTIKFHLTQTKHLHVTNIYIPLRDTTDPNHGTEDTDITNTFTHLTNIDNHLITGDINAHSHLWHSPTEDHRGILIADIVVNSNQITLNTNTPTTLKPATHLTRHHNHNKHTTKKHRLDHNADTQLRPSTHPDNLQNKDKLQNITAPQNLHKLQQSKLARIHTRDRTNTFKR